MKNNNYPKSENLAFFDSARFFITVASWDTGYGPTYEVGIREKEDSSKFRLIQGSWVSEDDATMAGEAISKLLDNGFMPSGIQRIFRG